MTLRVGIFGAGAIGGYLGVRLAVAGATVHMVGRRSLVRLRERLWAMALDGTVLRPPAAIEVTEESSGLAAADVVLVTVKSQATAEAGRILAEHLPDSTPVISFQNGLGNAAALREHLGARVVPGMVSFNVFREDEGACFRQATRGPLVCGSQSGRSAEPVLALAEALDRSGFPLKLRDDVTDVLAGKLLLNLNNGICAATGLPIAASLRSRDARWCLSRCMREGHRVLVRAGYRPASVVGLPPSIIARLLPLPNAIVLRVARRLVAVDPGARSSTLQDLDAGKPTEIEHINGAIVTLAEQHGLAAPANEVVVSIVRQLEQSAPPLPFVAADELRRRIAERR